MSKGIGSKVRARARDVARAIGEGKDMNKAKYNCSGNGKGA